MAADEGDGYLRAADVLPGVCSPAVVLYGQSTDCTFPLSRVAPLDPWLGPHVADEDVVYDDQDDDQADCSVEGDLLVCRGVFAYYSGGDRVVRPRISGELSSATATFGTLDGYSYPLQLTPAAGVMEPYVFGSTPLRVWAYGPVAAAGGFARVWLRDEPRYSWTVPLPAVAEDMVDPLEIDVGGLTPGRYRITPCIGDSAASCVEVPGGITFQVGSGRLEELIPGWNRRDADRINVIFAPSGHVSLDEARRVARDLVAWDGPLLVGFDDTLLGPAASPSQLWSLEFGPFAIEPLRSARDRFNLWFLDDLVDDPLALQYSAPPFGWGAPLPDFGLPDVQVTRLDFLPPGRTRRSEAGWPSFTSPDGPTVVTRDGLEFAGAYVTLPFGYRLTQAGILAHEWGHALFDLRDEYVESSRGVTHGYPNCAPDQATAEAWWGDQIGTIDPFVDEYLSLSRHWSQWVDPELVSEITTGFLPGGCYSDREDAAVRPTGDSIMNSGVPVFGAVNRQRAEQILALWSGLAPLDADALSAWCDPVRAGDPVSACGMEVVSHVEVPAAGLLASAGATTVGCSVVSGDTNEGMTFECDPLPLRGEGPWEVTFSSRAGDRLDRIVLTAPPPPPPEPTVVPAAVVATPVPTESPAGAWLLIGGLVAVMLASAAVLVRRRLATPTDEE